MSALKRACGGNEQEVRAYMAASIAADRDRPPPQLPSLDAGKALGKVLKLDFKNAPAMYSFYTHMSCSMKENYKLCENDNIRFDVVPDLWAGTPPLNAVEKSKDDEDDDGEDDGVQQLYPMLKMLTTVERLRAELRFPTLVLPLGRVVRTVLSSMDKEPKETGYVLVVDAINPGRPVWLVYDRWAAGAIFNEPPVLRSGNDEPAPTPHELDLDAKEVLFQGFGASRNFNAAIIFSQLSDWEENQGGLKKTSKLDFEPTRMRNERVTFASVNTNAARILLGGGPAAGG